MMALDDRLFYLLLGILIGLAMSKIDNISKKVDVMKKELDEVDEILKNSSNKGFMHIRVVRDVIVGGLLLATSYSAIQSGIAKNHSDDAVLQATAAAVESKNAAERVQNIGSCNRKILADLIISVNERAANVRGLGATNIEFQQSFRNLFGLLIHVPPFSQADQTKASHQFFKDQNTYIHKAQLQLSDVVKNPLPTIKDYNVCLKMKGIIK